MFCTLLYLYPFAALQVSPWIPQLPNPPLNLWSCFSASVLSFLLFCNINLQTLSFVCHVVKEKQFHPSLTIKYQFTNMIWLYTITNSTYTCLNACRELSFYIYTFIYTHIYIYIYVCRQTIACTHTHICKYASKNR